MGNAPGRIQEYGELSMKTLQKIGFTAAALSTTAPVFAAGPSAGDLTNLVPDASTILTAVGSVAVVMLGITLAIKGYRIVKSVMNK